ncbi:hypothetical protein QTJ16_003704 [Diplocarpon rosae]|uniref:Uncharacterized protein n=1 Tax=Diplocarpon rosae TaxID=946125 RepID=A0AAD9T0V9_9HELO|nr:hypothetical protein QTJ16_003704 [Diplocarpon rosae]
MSLSKAFTKRGAKPKSSLGHMKISAPLELISTTNMLSYNAPDIHSGSATSSSSQSGDESDRSPMDISTPMTSDNSSVEFSPITPEKDDLSSYFGASYGRKYPSDKEAPIIPQRSPSHTKKLSIERSNSRISASQKSSAPKAHSLHDKLSAKHDASEQHHPFSNELAQVTEIAEDYGITSEKLAVIDEEEQYLISHGLFKFGADDYMSEIHGLFLSTFGPVKPAMPSMWI